MTVKGTAVTDDDAYDVAISEKRFVEAMSRLSEPWTKVKAPAPGAVLPRANSAGSSSGVAQASFSRRRELAAWLSQRTRVARHLDSYAGV